MKELSFLASILGPVIAVFMSAGFTVWYDRRKRQKNEKLEILKNLMGNRSSLPLPEFFRALNIVPVVFRNDDKVQTNYRNLYDFVSNLDLNVLNNPEKLMEYNKRLTILIRSIARSLKYTKGVEETDIAQAFYPNPQLTMPPMPGQIPTEAIPVCARRNG